jgi:Effector-associated domain 7
MEEIKSLCTDTGIDFDEISGETKKAFVRNLIDYCERHDLLDEFIKNVSGQRRSIANQIVAIKEELISQAIPDSEAI